MKGNKNIINNTEEENSIDTISLIKRVWKERILVFKVTCTSFLLGCIVALLSPVIYESQTTLFLKPLIKMLKKGAWFIGFISRD